MGVSPFWDLTLSELKRFRAERLSTKRLAFMRAEWDVMRGAADLAEAFGREIDRRERGGKVVGRECPKHLFPMGGRHV